MNRNYFPCICHMSYVYGKRKNHQGSELELLNHQTPFVWGNYQKSEVFPYIFCTICNTNLYPQNLTSSLLGRLCLVSLFYHHTKFVCMQLKGSHMIYSITISALSNLEYSIYCKWTTINDPGVEGNYFFEIIFLQERASGFCPPDH